MAKPSSPSSPSSPSQSSSPASASRPASAGAITTDGWGIDDGYVDALGGRHDTPAETRAALRAAMGDTGAPGAFADVAVVREGETWRAPSAGTLELESGDRRDLAAGAAVPLPLGYHAFFRGEGAVRLIGCPRRCHLPAEERLWGWAAQLYAARSSESWGMGDLADLRRLGAWARALGARALMVNPLVAATPVPPIEPSPYFPSSRRFRNPLFLRVEEVPGAGALGGELEALARQGRALNARRAIDRDAVFRLKMPALERCFAGFGGAPAFDRYRAEQGEALRAFATYCAAAERHGKDWRRWPEELRRPDAPAVARFAAEHARRVEFHAWLQWQLDAQLGAAGADMPVIQDLPIGLDTAGADAWCWQDILASGVSVGAPPDELNPAGQDWGLTPFVPHRLRAAGYQPFIETIRATARHAGGLRIDHVMGLFRLYWIPRGAGAARGAYVRTRADELLGIVALESHRARAFVVGEDLGTVEPGVREAMADHAMLSYKLMFFEDQPPANLPALALTTVSTHDLPTVAGLLTGADLRRAQQAGAPQNEAGIAALRDKLTRFADLRPDDGVDAAVAKVHAALAQAPSRVLLASLDDALAVPERPNIPGARADWPNWSTALPVTLEELERHPLPRQVAEALRRPSR